MCDIPPFFLRPKWWAPVCGESMPLSHWQLATSACWKETDTSNVPFNFPLLFQGNNTNFSVLENLPRNHNLTLLFPNDFWFVKSIFFFPLSLTTHTFFSIFYFSKTAQTNECWVFLSQMAWKFSTRSSSIRLSIGLHGNFSWIFAMLVICKSGHANVLVGPRSSWRSGKGHYLGGSAQGLRCRIQGSEVFFEISLSKKNV